MRTPIEVAHLASILLCHQIEGEASYEAVCVMKPAIRKYSRKDFAKLQKGELIAVARDANDARYRGEALHIKVRPACAQPGGQTRSTVKGRTRMAVARQFVSRRAQKKVGSTYAI